jgi:hypothetical protein
MSVFNGARFLREAVDSVLGQSFRDFEFIIINDGSTDGSAVILDAYQCSDSRVHVLHQENKGLVASLNRGGALARGTYIARMDADDVALPDRLSRQVTFMERHPEVGAVGGAVHIIDTSGQIAGGLRFPTRDREIRRMLAAGECALCHPTVVMRAPLLKSLGGYRAAIVDAEDYDLWLRMADHAQLRNLDAQVLSYRRHGAQVSLTRFRRQALGNIAARTAARLRKEGREDPFDHCEEITPALLTRLGVSDATQQAVRDRAQLSCIASMIEAGERVGAAALIAEMQSSSDWPRAERSIRADLFLLATRLHRKQGQHAKSILGAGRAAVTRPIILARPLKQLLRRFRFEPRFDVAIAKIRNLAGWPPARARGLTRSAETTEWPLADMSRVSSDAGRSD